MANLFDYLVILKGGEGCDYTIGCGYRPKKVRAESAEHALRLVIREHSGWGSENDGMESFFQDDLITGAEIYKLTEYNDTLYDELHKRIVEKVEADDKRREEEAELAELERLKRKYES